MGHVEAPAASPSVAPAGALHAEAVRGGWRLVEVLERMTPEAAKRLLADHWRAQAEHAERTLAFLQPWDRVPARAMKVYRNTPDRVRMRRILDFVEPGDRVLDIGSGYGYLTGVILRDSPAAAYTGIDLGAHIVESARQMMAVNGLQGRCAHLEPMDLYDLTPEWVAGHAPNLLVCCEVLEHVPDAEKALRVIAQAMPGDAALLFSVPILGRLEACWGHVSLFDAARIQQMVAAAGLHVQHVEPLYNTWALVLVSPSPDPLPRLERVLARPPAVPPATQVRDPGWHRLGLTPRTVSRSRWRQRSREVVLDFEDTGVRCRVVGSRARRREGQYGGLSVRLPPGGLAAVRLELSFTGGHAIRHVYVDASHGRTRVGRWQWRVGSVQPGEQFSTVVLRHGQPTAHFTPVGRFDAARADQIDVFVDIAPGAEVTVALQRAAVVR